MKNVALLNHDFHKQNLVTLKGGGDLYKCSACGCEGIRPAFLDFVQMTNAQYKVAEKCTWKPIPKPVRNRPKSVLIADIHSVDLLAGVHDVVECPEEYKDKFLNDVWVYSEKRKEPVRLLDREIISKEF